MSRKSPIPFVTLTLISLDLIIGAFSVGSSGWLQLLGFTPSHASIGTVFSSLFVHAHPVHLAWNMLFLWLFGWHVEAVLGARRFLVLYFGSGVASVLCHWLFGVGFQPNLSDRALVGASGAISGLVGYFALRFYRMKVRLFWRWMSRWDFLMPVWVMVLLWIGWQVVGAVWSAGQEQSVNIGYWAHLGGFAAGFLLALLWGAGEREFFLREAESQLQQPDPEAALQWVKPLTQGANPDPEALRLSAEAWELLGDKALSADYYAQALKTYLRQSPPRFKEALLCAHRLQSLGKLQQAEPESLQRLLHWSLYQQNDPATAVRLLESLIQNFPTLANRATLLLRLADLLHHSLQQPQAAQKFLQLLIETYPNTPEADTARLWLRWRG